MINASRLLCLLNIKLDAARKAVDRFVAVGDALRRVACQRGYQGLLRLFHALPSVPNTDEQYELMLQVTGLAGSVCVPYGTYNTYDEGRRVIEWARLNASWIVEQINLVCPGTDMDLQSLDRNMFTWRLEDLRSEAARTISFGNQAMA